MTAPIQRACAAEGHDVAALTNGGARCTKCYAEWSAQAMRHASAMRPILRTARVHTEARLRIRERVASGVLSGEVPCECGGVVRYEPDRAQCSAVGCIDWGTI
jgi:hypothetical protein